MSTLSDPIADFLTRLRNAAKSHRGDVAVPYSKMKEEITRILKQEGYLADYEIDRDSKPALIRITMKFVHRTPALTGLSELVVPDCGSTLRRRMFRACWVAWVWRSFLLPAA